MNKNLIILNVEWEIPGVRIDKNLSNRHNMRLEFIYDINSMNYEAGPYPTHINEVKNSLFKSMLFQGQKKIIATFL